MCEFNQVQEERGKEHAVFRWLKEDRPKQAVCPTCTSILVSDYVNVFVQHHLIIATKYLSF